MALITNISQYPVDILNRAGTKLTIQPSGTLTIANQDLLYNNFNPNAVAAVPSLHAAYPLLVLLFAVEFFGKKGLIFIPYVIGCWLSIVYLGEHYVADIILGVIYTITVYYFTNRISNHRWFKK